MSTMRRAQQRPQIVLPPAAPSTAKHHNPAGVCRREPKLLMAMPFRMVDIADPASQDEGTKLVHDLWVISDRKGKNATFAHTWNYT